jgi:hypothetical protein
MFPSFHPVQPHSVVQEWQIWRQQQLAATPKMALLYAPLTPFHNDTTRSVATNTQ